jgi:hypothetical protein
MEKEFRERYSKLKAQLVSEGLTTEIDNPYSSLLGATKILRHLDEAGDLLFEVMIYCQKKGIDISDDERKNKAFNELLN